MPKLLMISFDAVGDAQFGRLAARQSFARLLARARARRGVDSVYLTNTYPVHTSVVTGVEPARHGLISNTEPFPKRHARWRYLERDIKVPTLWQRAAKKGLSVAAVLWPVTGGSKTIRWNIPELLLNPGENQIVMNLRYGSKLLQIKELRRHGKLLGDLSQPGLDGFATACMTDILREKNPDLALVHLTAFDTLCHIHGVDSPVLETALDALDRNLGRLLRAAGDREVILFSDHAQLPAETNILPNELLVERGFLTRGKDGGYDEASAKCFFECCAGSGFFHPGRLSDREVASVRDATAGLPGFARLLTAEELAVSGRRGLPFGFAARVGYAIEAVPGDHRANHGYPLDYDDYKVFYLHAGRGVAPEEQSGGSLLDIAPLAAGILGL